ncbi:glycosyltransferase family 20-domain-containing protein [Aspergillus stella-maris]|uniref:glycosyltransferase family 20-domain-containing protein n=1 Tax=Aspergillus stella-maris TaxID=1810926 RepID=UPI003CCE17AA
MTVYIASLFLPYTVSFRPPESAQPPLQKTLPQKPIPDAVPAAPTPAVSLFEKQNETPNVGLTPGATTDHESIFTADLRKADKNQSEYPFPTPGSSYNYEHLSSEAHSPAWGVRTALNQPKPQSAFLASPSILRHQEPRDHKIPNVDGPSTLPTVQHLRKLSSRSGRKPSFSETEWKITTAEQGNGGLRNAVRAASESGQLEDKVWVGTMGMPTDALTAYTKSAISEKLEGEYDCLPVDVNDSDFDGHYTHFCKTILWPVFHYQIPDNPKSKAYEDHSWVYYVKLNQLFADRIAKNWRRGDTIWVQDYHLLLVPAMLRKLLPDAQIGFFLHVAFPSSEVFRCLAPRKELLEGMLGANLVGFQTDEYCRHFLQTCSRILSVEATNDGLQLEDRFVNVTKFPIGIDPLSWDKRRKAADVEQWAKTISERYAGKRLIVARDKIDQVRGIRQKLLSYELFLNTHPEWREKVVLIQVATSTTEQPELEAMISDIVMRINSTHSTLAHQPLVFLKQDLAFPQYLALISVADAMMITSLREGMNLTSHEFVYCQDGKYGSQKCGSLILSEFTGSASVFNNHALLVNPWDYHQCANAIHTALTRSEEERQKVWQQLHQAVLQNSTSNWVQSFSETLSRVWHEQSSREIMAVPRLSINKLEEKYRQANRRLIVLDYEGTLASWGSPRSIIVTTPQRAITTLADLTEDPKNVVYVMSARMPEELERLFRMVSGLGLIAENGCFVREPNSETWSKMTNQAQTDAWKTAVKQILEYYQQRAEGSWIEQRHCSLVFHYEAAEDHPAACRLASECADHINDACANQGVHAILVDGVLVVETTSTNKASAAEVAWRTCLKQTDGAEKPDFLLAIGDSRDDEPVFRWANKLQAAHAVPYAMTVTLGSRSTEARATLTQGVAEAISVKPLGQNRYSAFLHNAFCIGTVPHGGYTSTILYRLALVHFETAHPTLYNREPATPISMHLTFLRRTASGPALLRVTDMKLGKRTSSIHIELLQAKDKPSGQGSEKDMEVKVGGYITVSPESAEVGVSSKTEWELHPDPVPGSDKGGGVDLSKLGATGRDEAWQKFDAPFSEFRRASTQVELYGIDPSRRKRKNGIVDQWARLKPLGEVTRWSNEAVVFLTDMFPMALDGFDTMAAGAEAETSGGGPTAQYWFPTVTLSIDLKKRLPVTGEEWLYSRVVTREVRNGRTDLDVTILDEKGEVVALSTQIGLVVSASRNIGKRAKI